MSQPLCIDLFCGLGGWAEGFLAAGYRVIGFDNDPRFKGRYPGELVLQDVRTIDGQQWSGKVDVIVASPPCNRFTTWNINKQRDPERGMILVREAVRVIHEAKPQYWALENVRGSIGSISAEIGPWRAKYGQRNAQHYIWGYFPGHIRPYIFSPKFGVREGGKRSGRLIRRRGLSKEGRAKIPFSLAHSLCHSL